MNTKMTPPPRGPNNRITSSAELMAAASAFRRSRILLTGFELNVWTALGEGRRSSADLARELRLDARGLDRLMNALVSIGLLKKEGGRFENTPLSTRHLVRGRPGYLGGLVHSVNLWDSWSTLTQAVARGGTVLRRHSSAGGRKARVRGFISAMHQRATAQAAATVKLLDLSNVQAVLDVGGGSGAYAMALVKAGPGIRATVFDLPDVIPLTRGYVKKAGLSVRFSFRAGDFNRDALGRGYDLILLSAIVHMNSPAANERLLAKCARALNRGGQVVIQDFIMDESRTRPAAGAAFALNMLVGTEAGDSYTEREIRIWMKAAGLARIRKIETPFDSSLMLGRKT
jgi:SAM-dependent methyltransferase